MHLRPLTAQTEAEVTFVVEPSSAEQIPPGEYAILAGLDVPANDGVMPGAWTVRANSDPVKIIIQDKPARLSPGHQEKLDLRFAALNRM